MKCIFYLSVFFACFILCYFKIVAKLFLGLLQGHSAIILESKTNQEKSQNQMRYVKRFSKRLQRSLMKMLLKGFVASLGGLSFRLDSGSPEGET